MPNPDLLTRKQATTLMSTTPRQIDRLVADGHLIARDFGYKSGPRFLRWEVESVDHWRRTLPPPPKRETERETIQREYQSIKLWGATVQRRAEDAIAGRPPRDRWLDAPPTPFVRAALTDFDRRTQARAAPIRQELCASCKRRYPRTPEYFAYSAPWHCHACAGRLRATNPRPRPRPDADTRAYIEVLRKDPCAYCGATGVPIEIDHIVPHSAGGPTTWENLTAACVDCNRKKRTRPLLAFVGVLNNAVDSATAPGAARLG
jgi:5-methylcytosine-specific restriction endonuclease McrA